MKFLWTFTSSSSTSTSSPRITVQLVWGGQRKIRDESCKIMTQFMALRCACAPCFLVVILAMVAVHCAAAERAGRVGGASGDGAEDDDGRVGIHGGGGGSSSVCGIGWAKYASLHERILATGEGDIVSFKPDPWRGYANQLLGISSAFAVALLTERAFFIDDGGSFSRIFRSPHIRWEDAGGARLAAERHRSSTFRASSGLAEEEEDGRDGLNEGIFVWDDLKDCDGEASISGTADAWDLSEMLGPFHEVEISTNILWWPHLFRNPLYSGLVSSWGMRSADDFFSCAMSYLLVPTDVLAGALEPLRAAMSRSSWTVGVQMRLNHETVS